MSSRSFRNLLNLPLSQKQQQNDRERDRLSSLEVENERIRKDLNDANDKITLQNQTHQVQMERLNDRINKDFITNYDLSHNNHHLEEQNKELIKNIESLEQNRDDMYDKQIVAIEDLNYVIEDLNSQNELLQEELRVEINSNKIVYLELRNEIDEKFKERFNDEIKEAEAKANIRIIQMLTDQNAELRQANGVSILNKYIPPPPI